MALCRPPTTIAQKTTYINRNTQNADLDTADAKITIQHNSLIFNILYYQYQNQNR